MAQNVKKVASKNLKKPKVAENSKSCQNSKKLPKISKVTEQLVAKPSPRSAITLVWCCSGGLLYKKGGDARREISIEPLKGTTLGVA